MTWVLIAGIWINIANVIYLEPYGRNKCDIRMGVWNERVDMPCNEVIQIITGQEIPNE